MSVVSPCPASPSAYQTILVIIADISSWEESCSALKGCCYPRSCSLSQQFWVSDSLLSVNITFITHHLLPTGFYLTRSYVQRALSHIVTQTTTFDYLLPTFIYLHDNSWPVNSMWFHFLFSSSRFNQAEANAVSIALSRDLLTTPLRNLTVFGDLVCIFLNLTSLM